MSNRLVLPPGWFGAVDIAEYRHLVQCLPDGATMVEVGVWLGRSLCSVASLIRRKRLRVCAVDTFTKRLAGGIPLAHSQRTMFNAHMKMFGITPEVYASSSLDAAVAFAGKADLVFLDDDHTYPHVSLELPAWLAKTTRIIAGHDYVEHGTKHPGVKRAVDEQFPSVRVRGTVWSVTL